MIQRVSEYLLKVLDIEKLVAEKIIYSIIAFLIIFVLTRLIQYIVKRGSKNKEALHRVRRLSRYVSTFLYISVILKIWIQDFQIGTFLGLMSAGLAIALKDYIVNFFAWFYIMIRRPLKIGDRIQLGDFQGDIVDIRLLQFTMLEVGSDNEFMGQSTGKLIYVPNGLLFSLPLKNYYRAFGHIWSEVKVTITFESNWKKAHKILLQILEDQTSLVSNRAQVRLKYAAEKYLIKYDNLTPIVYLHVQDNGIMLSMRYMCEPRNRRQSVHDLWQLILEEFSKNDDIAFAYPTTRQFINFVEGKDNAKSNNAVEFKQR